MAEDTTDMTSYYKQAAMTGLIVQYCFVYTDANRQTLKKYDNMADMRDYLKKQNLVEKFVTYAESNGLKRRNLMIRKSHNLLERYITSRIIYNMLNESAWSEYLSEDDPVIMKSLEVFGKGSSAQKK